LTVFVNDALDISLPPLVQDLEDLDVSYGGHQRHGLPPNQFLSCFNELQSARTIQRLPKPLLMDNPKLSKGTLTQILQRCI
jgi:hypothetical protein